MQKGIAENLGHGNLGNSTDRIDDLWCSEARQVTSWRGRSNVACRCSFTTAPDQEDAGKLRPRITSNAALLTVLSPIRCRQGSSGGNIGPFGIVARGAWQRTIAHALRLPCHVENVSLGYCSFCKPRNEKKAWKIVPEILRQKSVNEHDQIGRTHTNCKSRRSGLIK